MTIKLKISDLIGYDSINRQNIFRMERTDSGISIDISLEIPRRLKEDKKPISQNQRNTINSFYYNNDILPEDCGWQQASALLNMRSLSFSVSETLENGFLAENRIVIAPLISAYISQKPYLCAVARGWSLGNRPPISSSKADIQRYENFIPLISSPFYGELFSFALSAQHDIQDFLQKSYGDLQQEDVVI